MRNAQWEITGWYYTYVNQHIFKNQILLNKLGIMSLLYRTMGAFTLEKTFKITQYKYLGWSDMTASVRGLIPY